MPSTGEKRKEQKRAQQAVSLPRGNVNGVLRPGLHRLHARRICNFLCNDRCATRGCCWHSCGCDECCGGAGRCAAAAGAFAVLSYTSFAVLTCCPKYSRMSVYSNGCQPATRVERPRQSVKQESDEAARQQTDRARRNRGGLHEIRAMWLPPHRHASNVNSYDAYMCRYVLEFSPYVVVASPISV